MHRGLAVDALRVERPPVDPLGAPGALKRLVGAALPGGAQPLGAVGLQACLLAVALAVREPQHALAGLDIAVAEREVRMRVLRVLAHVMDGRDPGHPAFRHLGGEGGDQVRALEHVKLAGQRHHDLVDEAGVLAGGLLLGVHPAHGGCRVSGHVLGDDLGGGARAGDVFQVRGRRAGLMGGPADGLVIERVDRHRARSRTSSVIAIRRPDPGSGVGRPQASPRSSAGTNSGAGVSGSKAP